VAFIAVTPYPTRQVLDGTHIGKIRELRASFALIDIGESCEIDDDIGLGFVKDISGLIRLRKVNAPYTAAFLWVTRKEISLGTHIRREATSQQTPSASHQNFSRHIRQWLPRNI
jgi:hypothetical protein